MNAANTRALAAHRPRRRAGVLRSILVAFALFGVACGEDATDAKSTTRGPSASKTKPGAKGKKGATAEPLAELAPLVLKDEDFTESVRNRDPFRSYSTSFRAKAPEEMQRRVVMPTTPVEEMRLIAIVTGMPQPKAMLVDGTGVGYVVQRGDYVGRPKVIQATGSVSMALNWRIDRIRDNEVVLTQQDPAEPTRAALTKIIPLRDEIAQR